MRSDFVLGIQNYMCAINYFKDYTYSGIVVSVIHCQNNWQSYGVRGACLSALCCVSAGSNCDSLIAEVFATFTEGTTMPGRRVCTPVEQLQPFKQGRIIGLGEAGWTYGCIAAHIGHIISLVWLCFQQCSVELSHTHRPGSGRPHITDTCQDRCIVRAVVAV